LRLTAFTTDTLPQADPVDLDLLVGFPAVAVVGLVVTR
jgi:hypothetical protein